MKLENISNKTGKFTAKTLGAVKSAPNKTGNKTKSIKEAFVSGYRVHAPKKAETPKKQEVLDVFEILTPEGE